MPTTPSFPRRRLLRSACLAGLRLAVLLAALSVVLCVVLWAVLRAALAPQAGEWATTLGRGPLQLRASVPQLVWLATTPWIGQRLHGLRLSTRIGPVTLGWAEPHAGYPHGTLTLRCQPCALPLPAALGADVLRLPAAQLSLARAITHVNGQHLSGQLWLGTHRVAGDEPPFITARWQAQRQGSGWQTQVQWPETPVRHWLALLAPSLPELAHARIDGSLALHAQLHLPEGRLSLDPVLHGLAVQGLGTAHWAHLQSSCGPHVRLNPRGWLARAVLAAEDQRFDQHPGYDLPELLAALALNQQHATIRRGGSTLTQQLAKLLVTGGQRTLTRKLREWLYAIEMERTLGKARILQLYLNLAPWGTTADGRTLCGAEAAARHWFGVPAQRLTPAQAVTLAAMLRQPAQGLNVPLHRRLWVAEQVRGVPARQRARLLAQLAD
ncbi:MAG: biosynthetic peptidoglycan transglycosylase [Pseudomonadota bacterium]|nr:biosynthetic peptidoglycan transglycosylase [Pseudomonadota bacterium]